MQKKQKKHSVIARLSKDDAADLRDLQKLTGRTQADALRFAVRETARSLRIAEAIQTQTNLSPIEADEDQKRVKGGTHVTN